MHDATAKSPELLYVTAPDMQTAEQIAKSLVENGHAACVNILPGMRSVYHWQGSVETAAETVLIVKTTIAQAAAARDLVLDQHPYDTPCILALPISEARSSQDFLDWIKNQTGQA